MFEDQIANAGAVGLALIAAWKIIDRLLDLVPKFNQLPRTIDGRPLPHVELSPQIKAAIYGSAKDVEAVKDWVVPEPGQATGKDGAAIVAAIEHMETTITAALGVMSTELRNGNGRGK